jgi:superfamily II DNA helicase RecQ
MQSISVKLGFSLMLKDGHEQNTAINGLLDVKDVLAVLPTGFGKSLIFQIFVLVSSIERQCHCSALVVCPINSIVLDQIEAKQMGISACAISDVPVESLTNYQLIHGSAEAILSNTDKVKRIKNVV